MTMVRTLREVFGRKRFGPGKGAPWAVALLLIVSTAVGEEPPSAPAPELKGALLFSLLKLVTWPPGAVPATNGAVRLGVLGKHSFGDFLDRLAEKSASSSRPVVVRYANDEGALGDCNAIFVAHDKAEGMSGVLAVFGGRPVLLVGEDESFARQGAGGMVAVLVRDDRPVLQINLAAAEAAGLRFRAQLGQSKRVEWIGRPKP